MENRIEKMRGRPGRPVDQFKTNGEYIRTFNSITEASKDTHIPKGNICFCCNGNYHTAGRYIWRYAE